MKLFVVPRESYARLDLLSASAWAGSGEAIIDCAGILLQGSASDKKRRSASRASERSLKLTKFGQQILGPSSNGSFVGYMNSSNRVLRVPLSLPEESYRPGNVQDEQKVWGKAMNEVIHHDSYSLPEGSLEVSSGEYFEWYRRDGKCSFLWSCSLSLKDVMRKSQRVLGLPPANAHAVITIDGQDLDASTSRDVMKLAIDDEPAHFCRVNYDRVALAWTAPSPKLDRNDVNFGEFAMMVDADSMGSLPAVLQETATPLIAHMAQRLAHEFSSALHQDSPSQEI
ncbi:hypothetical protein [Arthrobacter sp. S2(2024)]|uniref:hypothetical protein n=1 Tax=Arthrobacter sp. S2(2024) TaxID=3111911 RepID=UPI002FCBA05D